MSETQTKSGQGKIAVILVRGRIGLNRYVLSTLNMLKLERKNYCVIVNDNPCMRGMLKKVKDYVTYGEISNDVYEQLVAKKAEEFKGRITDIKGKIKYNAKYFELNGKKYKRFFRLNPPIKGFGRKGIKKPFNVGGALGDRKDKINNLLLRMM